VSRKKKKGGKERGGERENEVQHSSSDSHRKLPTQLCSTVGYPCLEMRDFPDSHPSIRPRAGGMSERDVGYEKS